MTGQLKQIDECDKIATEEFTLQTRLSVETSAGSSSEVGRCDLKVPWGCQTENLLEASFFPSKLMQGVMLHLRDFTTKPHCSIRERHHGPSSALRSTPLVNTAIWVDVRWLTFRPSHQHDLQNDERLIFQDQPDQRQPQGCSPKSVPSSKTL